MRVRVIEDAMARVPALATQLAAAAAMNRVRRRWQRWRWQSRRLHVYYDGAQPPSRQRTLMYIHGGIATGTVARTGFPCNQTRKAPHTEKRRTYHHKRRRDWVCLLKKVYGSPYDVVVVVMCGVARCARAPGWRWQIYARGAL